MLCRVRVRSGASNAPQMPAYGAANPASSSDRERSPLPGWTPRLYNMGGAR